MKTTGLTLLLVTLAGLTTVALILGSLESYLRTPRRLQGDSQHQNQTPDRTQNRNLVNIPPGLTLKKIAYQLAESRIVTHPWFFSLGCRLRYRGKSLRAGEYLFADDTTPGEVMEKLLTGKIYFHGLTLPEGWTRIELARRIRELFGIEPAVFLAGTEDISLLARGGIEAPSLEGYLFPDTYHFPRGVSTAVIVRAMTERFFELFTDEMRQQAAGINFSINQIVTLASMIEKETAVPEERPRVSSVYHNRLKRNMRLQCDPTVIYAIQDFHGNLTKKDLELDSPYNTYRFEGLPPGPICSPGRDSIIAALHPESTANLYFVARGDRSGRHIFSMTLEEHNRAVFREQIQPGATHQNLPD